MLADVVFVWFGGVLLIGFIGFFVVVLSLLGRALRAIGRALSGSEYHSEGHLTINGDKVRICGVEHCGYLNRGHARYCARCGSPLDRAD